MTHRRNTLRSSLALFLLSSCSSLPTSVLRTSADSIRSREREFRGAYLSGVKVSPDRSWALAIARLGSGFSDGPDNWHTIALAPLSTQGSTLRLEVRSSSWALEGDTLWVVDRDGAVKREAPQRISETTSLITPNSAGLVGDFARVFGIDESRALVELESVDAEDHLQISMCLIDFSNPGPRKCGVAPRGRTWTDVAVLSRNSFAVLVSALTSSDLDEIDFWSVDTLLPNRSEKMEGGGRTVALAALRGREAVVTFESHRPSALPSFRIIGPSFSRSIPTALIPNRCRIKEPEGWNRVVGTWSGRETVEFLIDAAPNPEGLSFIVDSEGRVNCL